MQTIQKAMGKRRKRGGGFTLIEVIAVTVILGVLASFLLPSVTGVGEKARDAKLKNDLVMVDQAIELYRLEQGKIPTQLDELVPDYVAPNKGFKDTAQEEFQYTATETSYTLSGQNTKGETVLSDGSAGSAAGEES